MIFAKPPAPEQVNRGSHPGTFMPDDLACRDDLETIASDEKETFAKIVEVMTDGLNVTREKCGKAVRISHAKAHGLLNGG